MAKQIAKLLRTETMADIDLKGLAQILKSKGRGRDTLLAHITPKEAEYLKRRGGSGTINPHTGLLEFDDGGGEVFDASTGQAQAPEQVAAANPDLYPGGKLPGAGQATQYAPGGAASYIPSTISSAPVVGGASDSGLDYSLGPATGGVGLRAGGVNPNAPVYPSAYSVSQTPNYSITTPGVVTPFGQDDTSGQLKLPGMNAPQTQAAPTQDGTTFGLSNSTLARLGLVGGLGLLGAAKSKQESKATDAAIAQQKAIAQPYQATGATLQRAAAAGELTPQSMQSYQAAQAQLQQQVANTGGVGAAQAAATLENLRQTLLSNQYNYGLQVSQIGDSIALGAIQQGMQLDQQLNQASTNFYTQLAAIGAGSGFNFGSSTSGTGDQRNPQRTV